MLHYFGFQQDPFGISPDPRCIYPSETHREALSSLKYGLHSNRGFSVIIAPPGMGKTTLLFRFLEDCQSTTRSVFLFNIDTDCEPQEFVAYILRDLGITPAHSSSEMHEQLSEFLTNENRAGRNVLVVIDEAQNLSTAVLEKVRLLTNFETSRGKLLQLVVSGQPQLSEKLLNPSLAQLLQRISTVCHLEPLSPEGTAAYIAYRLKLAGYEGKPLFTEHALRQIADASQGIPRTINNLCFNALSLCQAMNRRQVDSSMVAEVIADLRLIPQVRKNSISVSPALTEPPYEIDDNRHPKRILKRLLVATAPLVFLCAAGLLGISGLRTSASHRIDKERSLDQSAPLTSIAMPTTLANEIDAYNYEAKPKSFEITVHPGQQIGNIAVQYLGGFDLQRLRQIQVLNPKLTDPNYIEVGQKIWLPGSLPATIADDATAPARERTLP
jgi:general secretion pathway protein A